MERQLPGLKENFWAMGDTGPCGPCSEIFYDMGPAASDHPDRECQFPCDCGRYLEIWNLVFMQFNRDASGTVAPLPKPSIDTGAGLERLAAVMLNLKDSSKVSNYDTDLFEPLIKRAYALVGEEYAPDSSIRLLPKNKFGMATVGQQPSYRVIADHSRAATFLISDGVVPSNDGRGYVLRKIIRRALLHVQHVGGRMPFLSQMAESVRTEMKDAYPELMESAGRITTILNEEEGRFLRTIDVGLKKLYEQTKPLQKNMPTNSGTPTHFPGDKAFQLYDTFGLPLDFMREVLSNEGFLLDETELEKAMQEQRRRARASWKGGHKAVANPAFVKLAERYRTEPDFYFETTAKNRRIEAIVTKDGAVNELPTGAEGEIVLDRTVFYSESGGQVSDIGTLWNNEHTLQLAEVRGAYYPVSGLIAHRVLANEKLVVGERVAGDADGDTLDARRAAQHSRHARQASRLACRACAAAF
jgi:alanyl-tRNA synthetase